MVHSNIDVFRHSVLHQPSSAYSRWACDVPPTCNLRASRDTTKGWTTSHPNSATCFFGDELSTHIDPLHRALWDGLVEIDSCNNMDGFIVVDNLYNWDGVENVQIQRAFLKYTTYWDTFDCQERWIFPSASSRCYCSRSSQ